MILHPTGVPRAILAFGPGAGGDPTRYSALLDTAASAGFLVAAPAHERFDPRSASDEQVRERALGLAEAIAEAGRPDLPVLTAGHSVGAWAALCLAGAQPWSRAGHPIPVPVEARVTRVVALAPPLGWFLAPGALDALRVPVTAFAGESDLVTPPDSTEILRTAPAQLRVQRYPGVGHLDFLSTLPPGVSPTPGLDHAAFLAALAGDFAGALDGGV